MPATRLARPRISLFQPEQRRGGLGAQVAQQ
ncbi:hypothetical protein M2282_003376 [Variovorax boronicumulans]|nr:hypothetical protein [Variovorax boronicumulans]